MGDRRGQGIRKSWQIVRCCVSCVAAAIVLLLPAAAFAQEYRFRSYGMAEGLQNLVVLSLAQDKEGYLWTGTEGGLYRYDGTHFQLMGTPEGLPCSTETHGLFVAADGTLWANTCSRVSRFDGKRFEQVAGVDTMLRGAQVMADGANGSVLVAAPTGLYEISRGADGSLAAHPHTLPPSLSGRPMHGVLRQGARLWFGCGQQLCLEEAGQVSVFGQSEGLPEDSWDGIQTAPDGSIWVRSAARLYRRAPGQTEFSQENPDLASSGFWGALTIGRDGSVMVPTDQGLAVRTEAGWKTINRHRGLQNDTATAVLQDREGSIWVGLAGAGVVRWLGQGRWESWTVDQGLPSNLIWSIRRDKKGMLWVGTGRGLARFDNSGEVKTWTRADGLGGDNIRWLAETSDGSIWAAMKPGGLARIDPTNGKIRMVGSESGLLCNPEDLFVDQRDRIWVPTSCGIFRNDRPAASDVFVRIEAPEDLNHGAWKVLVDRGETVWVTNRQGLWRMQSGRWQQYRKADGLLSDDPYVMALAADGSLWLRHRYNAGVERVVFAGSRIAGATAVVPSEPMSVAVTAFHGFDAAGNFWRGSADGVSVLSRNVWTRLTVEDGLVWNDCDGEAFWADADGGVWLGTSGGLSHYNPGREGLPGPLIAEPIIAGLEITQRPRLIRAEFSSLTFRAEQLVKFAYRIDDEPWIDSKGRSVSIAGLGPGSHRLEVRCLVRDGPFSTTIASEEFRISPRWTETWWARVLAVACLLMAVSLFVRWRLRAATLKRAELEALVASRTEHLTHANRALDETASQLRSSQARLRLLFRQAPAGIFLFDRDLTVTECNDQFRSLLHLGSEGGAGMRLSAFKEPEILQTVNAALEGREGSYEGPLTPGEGPGCTGVALTTVPLWDEDRQLRGGIGLAVDISERKRAEAEREHLIANLQHALAEIKTLSGLLPICANCKKIRDDEGYWTQVESFISRRTNVQFTHGVCPECCNLLYPELSAEDDPV